VFEPNVIGGATSRLARDLYAIYCASSGGLNYQGKPCPAWDALPEAVRGHWHTVVLRVYELVGAPVFVDSEGRESDPSPSGSIAHLPNARHALEAWRRYSGIDPGSEPASPAAQLADEMRRGVAKFVSPADTKAPAVRDDRAATVLFCSLCFANDEDGGSWGGGVCAAHCFNCGAGGSVVTLPKHAADAIRKSASWVGKRYYPSDEDREIQAELRVLRGLITDFPGRTAREYTDPVEGGPFWVVEQRTGPQGYTSQMFPRLPGETPADGIVKSRLSMRYVAAEAKP
jgi:hypothetical protein